MEKTVAHNHNCSGTSTRWRALLSISVFAVALMVVAGRDSWLIYGVGYVISHPTALSVKHGAQL
ncbi:MAG: hypothetical protein PUF74_00980 [Sodaliphilus pleomorphus]|uniref:hypothetical protein n=1 Tax=Sodaliphilus pleomorphus TaxID=2606626 RepID=UPI00240936C8|nr:hypothetical protein [Sodaliphilus pleomorphus]MDD6474076.1 hypothetical protein [Sodaliphilus pleomorphus]